MEEQDNLSGLGQFVLKTFSDFKEDRKLIEEKWEKNISAYNRELITKEKEGEGEDWRSKTFIGITKQKVIAAYSIVKDSLVKDNKVPFFLSCKEEELQDFEQMDPNLREQIDQNKEIMEAKIHDQIKKGKSGKELDKCILSCAIYGESYGKSTIEEVKEEGYEEIDGVWQSYSKNYNCPKLENVSVWDIYRDVESEDLQYCRGVIHRKLVSPFELKEMSKGEYFLEDQVKIAIGGNEAYNDPEDTSSLSPAQREISNRKKSIRVLEFWGRVPVALAEDFENRLKKNGVNDFSMLEDFEENSGNEVEIMAVMANDLVVRYVRIEKNTRPFYRAVWEEPVDGKAGVGISDNIEQIQSVLNGSVRQFLDNKNITGNATFAIKRRLLHNQVKSFKPGQSIEIAEDCEDVRQAIQPLQFPDVGESMMSMINLSLSFADDESSVPRVQQGAGASGQETAFELSQRLEKSGKYLGGVIGNFDAGIIEPLIKFMLEFNMTDPDAEGKANYKAVANGFTSFQDRLTKIRGLRQALELAQSNETLLKRVKFDQLFKEFTSLLDVDADRWFMNDKDSEEQDRLEAENQQRMIQLETAKINAEIAKMEAEVALTNAKANAEVGRVQIDAEKLKLEQRKAITEEIEQTRDSNRIEKPK
jgi:hypothetical protein